MGQAEYFDLLRGISSLVKPEDDTETIKQWIKALASFSSQKGQKRTDNTASLPEMGDESNGG